VNTDTERIAKAIRLAVRYGGIDGDHHKTWVIDQMCRALLSAEAYQRMVKDACDGEDGPNTYEWDKGTPP
jgi:hypothetical protein